jgi:capsular exopolysaccharide synthesis family protein
MDVSKIPTPAEKLHFLDYWRIIRMRKTVILAVFLLVVLTTTAVTFILPKSYSSTVRISVEKDAPDINPLLAIQPQAHFDPYFIQTEFEKIQSKKILYKVVSDLGLTKTWAARYHVDKLSDLECVAILRKVIDVRQSRNTSLIEIRAFSEDRAEAAVIANKLAAVYRESRMSVYSERAMEGIRALKGEFEDQNAKVTNALRIVDDLKQKLNISDVEGGGIVSSTEAETVRRLDAERTVAQSRFIEMDTLFKRLKAMSRAELRKAILIAYPGEQELPSHLARLSETLQKLALLSPELGPEHAEIKKLTSLQAELERQINERLEGVLSGLGASVESAKARVEDMARQVEVAKQLDAEKTALHRPYGQAKRDLENQLKIRDAIQLRVLQETVDSKLPKNSMVEIVEEAEPGLRPVRPNIPLNITLGVIVGLVVGVGLAFFIEYLDTSVKTIDDVEKALQAPVLGVIPQNVGSLILEGPESPHAEAYRVLRTNVLFSRKDQKLNALTVVSGGAGEGKSTTIFNLAVVFAQNDQRVLLVDSDLRRPSIHKILNVSNSQGLTNYLLRQSTLEQVVQTTPVPTLHFVASGKLPSSSLGILNSQQMKEFIKEVKARYDFVFFDSPPIMGVSDASVLASEVDMTLLVIQYRKYPQNMTIRAKQMVEKVGGTLLGVVLNNINISQDSYYYYYSGYYYDYYSKDDDSGDRKSKSSKAPKSTKPDGDKKAPGEDRAQGDLKQKY